MNKQRINLPQHLSVEGARVFKDVFQTMREIRPLIFSKKGLYNGRELKTDNGGILFMKPRETWANCLLTFLVNAEGGEKDIFTVADIKDTDGVILNKVTEETYVTEHVFAGNHRDEKVFDGDLEIIKVLDGKLANGAEYAKGKNLIIFCDSVQAFHPLKIRRHLENETFFSSVWLITLNWHDAKNDSMEYFATRIVPLSPVETTKSIFTCFRILLKGRPDSAEVFTWLHDMSIDRKSNEIRIYPKQEGKIVW